jgi:hypothetical protein
MIHNQILKSLLLILLVKTKNKIDEIDFKNYIEVDFQKEHRTILFL